MKIAYVTAAMLPWEVHGLTVHVNNLVNEISKTDQVKVIYTAPVCKTNSFLEEVDVDGIPTLMVPSESDNIDISFPDNSMGNWISANFFILQNWDDIREYVRSEQFDIAHFQDYYSAGLLPIFQELGIPIVCTIHALSESSIHFSNGIRMWLMANSQKVITVSNWEKAEITRRGLAEIAKQVTIYNGAHITPYRIKKREYITFVGRLEEKKGCDLFLSAVKMIGKDFFRQNNFRILIMGDGSERTKLENFVEKSDLREIVEFAGMVPHEQILENLQGSTLHVVPSRSESFGLSAVESIAEGAYTIVSDIDGLKEAIEGSKLAASFPKDSISALAKLMTEKLMINIDESIRYQESQKIAKKFSWTEVAIQTRKLYNSILTN